MILVEIKHMHGCVCVCVCVFEDRSEPSILSSMCKGPEVGRNLVHLTNLKV